MTPTDPNASAPASAPVRAPRVRGWYIPWVVLGIVAVYLLSVVGRMNPPSKPYDLAHLATLPVVEGGRIKPLETVARINLRLISQREYFVDEHGDSQPAIKWYMDVVATGGRDARVKDSPAWKHRVFRIENDQLLAELGLKPREGLRYSLEEFGAQIPKIAMKGDAVQKRKDAKKPIDLYDAKVLELYQRLKYYFALAENHDPRVVPPQEAGQEFVSLDAVRSEAQRDTILSAVKAVRSSIAAPEREQAAAEKVIAAAKEADNAKAKRDNRDEDKLAPLLDLLAGGGNLPTDPRVLRERFAALLREPLEPMGAEDLRDRFIAFGGLLSEDELLAAQRALLAGEQKRLADRAAANQWIKIVDAYRENKPAEFNTLLTEYREKYLGQVSGHDLNKIRGEAFYNRFAPFYQCTALYVLAFILCALSWFGMTEPLRRSAFYTLCFTLVIHTSALVARMYFQDRWSVFVTNLYSSAVFIGWGCVVLGLILEKLYPIGIGNLVASVLGVATTIISHNLGAGGDTLEMMRAVLDTNFWLATHVTTVTFGYTATFVAGFIGIAYIARTLATVIRDSFKSPGKATPADLIVFGLAAVGLVAIPVMIFSIAVGSAADFEVIPSFAADILTFLAIAAGVIYAMTLLFARSSAENVDSHSNPIPGQLPSHAKVMENLALDSDSSKKLTQMIYGVLCFATLLSFVGTVLGGIWADQSWGRFWGWDPKENGAILIVLWNALILHARWCGLVRDRGLAVLAVAGNMVTAWSWFGTNQLGIGLHAYGFDDRLAKGCSWFWMSQLVIIGLGMIPRSYWSSATKRAGTGGLGQTGPVIAQATSQGPTMPVANGTMHASHPKPAKGKKQGKKR